MKKAAPYILIFLLFVGLETKLRMNQQKQMDVMQIKCDSIQRVADSLHSENYPCQIELGRYQLAYEILLERNAKAATQFGDIIANETE